MSVKEKIIIGDNPFFGVNHRSSDKAREYEKLKGDWREPFSVLQTAAEYGLDSLMISTHAEAEGFLRDYLRHCSDLKLKPPKLQLVCPYAHKLNTVVAQKGLLGPLTHFDKGRLFAALVRDLISTLSKRELPIFPSNLAKLFLSDELKIAQGYDVEHICIQNVISDLLLGIFDEKFFKEFCDTILEMGYLPLFITMNPLEMDKVLPEQVAICFHYNINSFMVQPSLQEVQQFMIETKRPFWLMGILASGSIKPVDALSDPFISGAQKILYATRSKSRLEESLQLF